MKIYGPYTCADGRKRILFVHEDGTRNNTSYARWLMEQKLGRSLTDNETVDHIDGDRTNNDITNLQVLSLVDNIRKSAKQPEMIEITCLGCGTKAIKHARYVRHSKKQGKAGPFCSKSCAGRYRR